MKQFPTHIVAVDGVIENDRGEILLVKSARHGLYGVPGGQVENGENLTDALKREVREETGADIEVGKLICVSSNTRAYPGYNGYETVPTKVMLGFVCRYLGGELRPSDETTEVIWVGKDKALEYITAPHLIERIAPYLQQTEGVRYLEYNTKPAYELLCKRDI